MESYIDSAMRRRTLWVPGFLGSCRRSAQSMFSVGNSRRLAATTGSDGECAHRRLTGIKGASPESREALTNLATF
ncbi:hypothetical protein HA44_08280 [Mixta gaviniae]|nr:hypothetical protein HA44_08280 [Mixta gaviniae]